jgi:hypothetical protein
MNHVAFQFGWFINNHYCRWEWFVQTRLKVGHSRSNFKSVRNPMDTSSSMRATWPTAIHQLITIDGIVTIVNQFPDGYAPHSRSCVCVCTIFNISVRPIAGIGTRLQTFARWVVFERRDERRFLYSNNDPSVFQLMWNTVYGQYAIYGGNDE